MQKAQTSIVREIFLGNTGKLSQAMSNSAA